MVLGGMYIQGQGVLKDFVVAHMWLNICGSIGNKNCLELRNELQKIMTSPQIEKAQEMARNWKPKK
jgi:hypothetical protein